MIYKKLIIYSIYHELLLFYFSIILTKKNLMIKPKNNKVRFYLVTMMTE